MRVMVMIKATADCEAGVLPAERVLAGMMAINGELARSGVLLAAGGLTPSALGARVHLPGRTRGEVTAVDGPFEASRDLVAGFWLWQVRSMEEALEWARRIPNPENLATEIELRPVLAGDDPGETLTPERRARAQARARTGH